MVATDAELFFAQVVVGQIDKPGCGCHSGSAYPSNLAD
jgi:anaerobic selenocysteine-containing dehydrogenase